MGPPYIEYQTAFDPESKKSCVVIFFGNRCGFRVFDHRCTISDIDPKTCLMHDIADILARLDYPFPQSEEIKFNWMAMEILRRYVVGQRLPDQCETGIERHFRELEEQAKHG
jgi:hypothetical protein